MIIEGNRSYYDIKLAYAKIKEEADNARCERQSHSHPEFIPDNQRVQQDCEGSRSGGELRHEGPQGLPAVELRP